MKIKYLLSFIGGGAAMVIGLMLGGGTAHADTLSPAVAANAPVTVCGNSVAALGAASSACGAPAPSPAPQGAVSVNAPVTAAGNAVAAAGIAQGTGPSGGGSGTTASSGAVAANAPVTVCGNGAGVLGGASGSCGSAPSGSAANGGLVAANAPVTVCGDSVGNAASTCNGAAPTTSSSSGGIAGANTPVTVCGNGIGLLGAADGGCGTPAAITTVGNPVSDGNPLTGPIGALPPMAALVSLALGSRGTLLSDLSPAGLLTAARTGSLPFTGSALALLASIGTTVLGLGAAALRFARPSLTS